MKVLEHKMLAVFPSRCVWTFGLALLLLGCGNHWKLQQELVPSGIPANGRGHAIALDGDLALVGTYEPYGAELYEWDGATWVHLTSFSPRLGTNPAARFGESVAIDGDTLIIGAPIYLNNAFTDDYGYLDVYRRNVAGEFVFSQAVVSTSPSNDGDDHNFGAVARLDGSYLVVGDPFFHERVGQVFVYKEQSGNFVPYGSAIPSPDLSLSDGHFGHAVAITGDLLAISQPGRATTSPAFDGAVHLYSNNGSEFVYLETISAPESDPSIGKAFGSAIDLHEDELVVTERGRLRLYRSVADEWTSSYSFALEVGDYSQRRQCVALGTETMVVGEYRRDSDRGLTRVYEGSAYQVDSALMDPAEDVAREFGGVVALSGSRLLVSTGGKSLMAEGDDSIFVYARED